MKHGSVSIAQFLGFMLIELYFKSNLSLTSVFLFHSFMSHIIFYLKGTENKWNFILFYLVFIILGYISGRSRNPEFFGEKERTRKNCHNLRRRFYNLVEFTLIIKFILTFIYRDENSETIVQNLYSLFPCIYDSRQLYSCSIFCLIIT